MRGTRYEELHPLRGTRSFRWLSARRVDAMGVRSCVLVVPTTATPRSVAALERLADAHARIRHPSVPRTVEMTTLGGLPAVELDAAAVSDGIGLLRSIAVSGERIPYTQGDAYIVEIRRALRAAHDEGFFLGRISGANVLITADGRPLVFGFGHNVCVNDEDGLPDPTCSYFQAIDVSAGGPPSSSGDYVALLMYMRSLFALVDPIDALARIVRGVAAQRDASLVAKLAWIEMRVMGALPGQRASMDEAVAVADEIRALLRVEVDPDGMRRTIARAARVWVEPARSRDPRLTVGPDGEWAAWNDAPPVRLRSAMRRVLLALVENHVAGVTSTRTVELVERGWPDEQIEYEAALNRVYVTITRLRRAFSESLVQRYDDGYRIDQGVEVVRVRA